MHRRILTPITAFLMIAPAVSAATIDSVERTATTARFVVDWSNGTADPEAIGTLTWRGGSNLAPTFGVGGCNGGDVEYFGNSWAPPDPDAGLILVGAGSAGTWKKASSQVVAITSAAAGCPASAGVRVRTRYRFVDRGPRADTIRVQRTFQFRGRFPFDFRPYMPRLAVADFPAVLHPDAAGTQLLTEDVVACGFGCQVADWDGSWFALYAPLGDLAGTGVIVFRQPSKFRVALWIDNDFGSGSNVSSAIALQPPGGFTGRVTEREQLCFFDATTWTPAMQNALTLPPGCDAWRQSTTGITPPSPRG